MEEMVLDKVFLLAIAGILTFLIMGNIFSFAADNQLTVTKYCSSINNLTVVVTRWNPINATWVVQSNVIPCDGNLTCSNNSFFGPSCDPPIVQRPFWIIGAFIAMLLFLAGSFVVVKYIGRRIL